MMTGKAIPLDLAVRLRVTGRYGLVFNTKFIANESTNLPKICGLMSVSKELLLPKSSIQ